MLLSNPANAGIVALGRVSTLCGIVFSSYAGLDTGEENMRFQRKFCELQYLMP